MIETSDMNGVNLYGAQSKTNNTENKASRYNGDDEMRVAGNYSARHSIEDELSAVGQAPAGNAETFSHALAYADQEYYGYQDPQEEEFGFGDVIDMVNPLQHIPLVGSIYRGITGDEIKPISRIVGGAVFSGGVGAAGSLINVVVEEETGEDIAGNMIGFVAGGGHSNRSGMDHPEIQLNRAARDFEHQAYEELPPTVLGFTDLGYGLREVYTQHEAADGRTAGSMVRSHTEVAAPNNAPRDPISEIEFAPFRGLNVREFD